MNKAVVWYFLLYIVTFGVLAPYFCTKLVFSLYFVEKSVKAQEILEETNRVRRLDAEHYLRSTDANKLQAFYDSRLRKDVLDILAVVKTIDRTAFQNNPYTGYLTQTITALDRQIKMLKNSSEAVRVGILICNTDPAPSEYSEALFLASYYPTVSRWGKIAAPSANTYQRRETEKEDYGYCIKVASERSRARYLLMVEDDAEPYSDLFNSLEYILTHLVNTKLLAGEPISNPSTWAFVKLYYPERWAGFSWDVRQVSELIGIGCIGGTIFQVLAAKSITSRTVHSWMHFTIGAIYVVVLAVAVGRQYLLEMRRYSTSLLTVDAAYACCTPAVLYPAHLAESIVQYLATVTCTSTFGVDLALDEFAQKGSYARYLIQPNLFHHRGAYSSLTDPKRFEEFLFDSSS